MAVLLAGGSIIIFLPLLNCGLISCMFLCPELFPMGDSNLSQMLLIFYGIIVHPRIKYYLYMYIIDTYIFIYIHISV